MDAETFLKLCQGLRALGMTEVSADGYVAKFGLPMSPVAKQPTNPTTPRPLRTPEEIREEAYARELGLVK